MDLKTLDLSLTYSSLDHLAGEAYELGNVDDTLDLAHARDVVLSVIRRASAEHAGYLEARRTYRVLPTQRCPSLPSDPVPPSLIDDPAAIRTTVRNPHR